MPITRGIARRIRLVVLDADGVLTDGGLYMARHADGSLLDLRRFHIRDGIGILMLRMAGIDVAIVSAKDSEAVRARARELGIEELHQVEPDEKVRAVEGILNRRGIGWPEAAHLADDLADIAVLQRVGLPAAVADAVPEVRAAATWQGTVPGGHGAVREFAEALLAARGEWDGLVARYVRGDVGAEAERQASG